MDEGLPQYLCGIVDEKVYWTRSLTDLIELLFEYPDGLFRTTLRWVRKPEGGTGRCGRKTNPARGQIS
jgi:hypothetical protein